MQTRKFPIMNSSGTKVQCPSWIPWEVIEPYEGHAMENHQQTLVRLAERGGLDPVEAYFVLTGRRWNNVQTPVSKELERAACEYLNTLVTESQVAKLVYERDHEREQKEMRHSAWLDGQAEIGRLKGSLEDARYERDKAEAEIERLKVEAATWKAAAKKEREYSLGVEKAKADIFLQVDVARKALQFIHDHFMKTLEGGIQAVDYSCAGRMKDEALWAIRRLDEGSAATRADLSPRPEFVEETLIHMKGCGHAVKIGDVLCPICSV